MRYRTILTIVSCGLLGAVSACTQSRNGTPASSEKSGSKPSQESREEVAIIETDKGTMVIEFWPEVAPNTVANFKKLARKDFYDGTAFHRIVDDFMIQGGDPLTKDPSKSAKWGTGGPGYTIDAELNDRSHTRGVISMARGPDVDSAGSQFFICLEKRPSLDGKYTAFGKLIRGDDVLTAIGKTPTEMGPSGREKSRPKERVGVKEIRIMAKSELPEEASQER